MWVEVRTQSHVLAVCVCYRSPTEGNEFWDDLQDSVNTLKIAGYQNIIIVGDLNADPSNRPVWNKCKSFCHSLSLISNINEATRITPTSATILDQVLTSNKLKVNTIIISPPLGRSDHCQVTVDIPLLKIHRPSVYNRLIWQYEKADWEGMNDALLQNDWDTCFNNNNVDDCATRWT